MPDETKKHWPIARMWAVRAQNLERVLLPTSSLGEMPVCFLLGPAGQGKTYEIARLADLDRAQQRTPIVVRLAVIAQSPSELDLRLTNLAKRLTQDTVVYLDAIDEILLQIPTAAIIVGRWVRESLVPTKAWLRISCRSAVWPALLQNELSQTYPEAVSAILQPLSTRDVEIAARSEAVDVEGFVKAVTDSRAEPLAAQPLTLAVLLRIHRTQGKLPGRRTDLFNNGVALLAREREDRVEAGSPPVDVPRLLDVAERLACFTLLTGLETVSFERHVNSLSTDQLATLPHGGLDGTDVRALTRSALIDSSEPRQFRFVHRQFAEFLAGRHIASLLPHQAKALLASGLGWRAGVPRPLRETAAFAAMHSDIIAEWLIECDPEVIGVSDVADDQLRRRATLKLLAMFRDGSLTAAQIWRTDLEVSGFRYPGAEEDLRPVLRERGSGAEEVLECALKLIHDWQLATMSDDLADVMLDCNAPRGARVSAGYCLFRFGTDAVGARLRALLVRGLDDPDGELKGLALRVMWPVHLTTTELLNAFTPPPRRFFAGAYSSFVAAIDRSDFSSQGQLSEGLDWLRRYFEHAGGFEGIEHLAERIARAAIRELSDAEVARRLAILLVSVAARHSDSPLGSQRSQRPASDKRDAPIPWTSNRRRVLIGSLVEVGSEADVWWVANDTPGLLDGTDFRWLLQRATDDGLPFAQRAVYADLARMLPWKDSSENVDAWFKVRTVEPIASKMSVALLVKLRSPEADEARRLYRRVHEKPKKPRRKRLRPSPHERVQTLLDQAEKDDPAFFFALCRDLTLEDFSTHYGFERFVVRTPGWIASDAATRRRIVDASKRVLLAPSSAPDTIRSESLNTIKGDYPLAVWLLLDQEPSWLDALDDVWWTRWAWYLIRELRPHFYKEPDEPKLDLLRRLADRAPSELRAAVIGLATDTVEGADVALSGLLDVLEDIRDATLDDELLAVVSGHRVPESRISRVAEFVLRRAGQAGLQTFATLLTAEVSTTSEAVVVRAAAALIAHATRDGWDHVQKFLRARPDLSRQILGEVFYRERFLSTRATDGAGPASMTAEQLGDLLSLLFEVFPPDTDPQYDEAHEVTPDDAARTAREHLMTWLGEQQTPEAVTTLRYVDERFGSSYSWLRSARILAERRFRLAQWRPLDPKTIGEVLHARDKRLIRSDTDARDAVVEALEDYARRLRLDQLGDREDFWNIPRRGRPTPKNEERASDKICSAIRHYLREYAVTADREVQIVRRLTPSTAGGAPGSKPDVVFRVPAATTTADVSVSVPVEVKLSFNPQARTGLQEQLAGRYIPQVAATGGVFVLVWTNARRLAPSYRPAWSSPAEAEQDLSSLAAEERTKAGGADIRVVLIDASLPTDSAATPRHRRNATAKPRGLKPSAGRARVPTKRTSAVKAKTRSRRPRKTAAKAHGPKLSAGRTRTPTKRTSADKAKTHSRRPRKAAAKARAPKPSAGRSRVSTKRTSAVKARTPSHRQQKTTVKAQGRKQPARKTKSPAKRTSRTTTKAHPPAPRKGRR